MDPRPAPLPSPPRLDAGPGGDQAGIQSLAKPSQVCHRPAWGLRPETGHPKEKPGRLVDGPEGLSSGSKEIVILRLTNRAGLTGLGLESMRPECFLPSPSLSYLTLTLTRALREGWGCPGTFQSLFE